jgi:hypothetical protein
VLPLFQGVYGMHESSTYQYILDEGAVREAKRILMRLGLKRLRLERMTERVNEVAGWQELLETP